MKQKEITLKIIFLAWLIPGLGHWLLNKKCHAILIFTIINAIYFSGMIMADFRNVSIQREFYHFWIYIFAGLPTIISFILTYSLELKPIFYFFTYNTGLLYTFTASLLNFIVIVKLISDNKIKF